MEYGENVNKLLVRTEASLQNPTMYLNVQHFVHTPTAVSNVLYMIRIQKRLLRQHRLYEQTLYTPLNDGDTPPNDGGHAP